MKAIERLARQGGKLSPTELARIDDVTSKLKSGSLDKLREAQCFEEFAQFLVSIRADLASALAFARAAKVWAEIQDPVRAVENWIEASNLFEDGGRLDLGIYVLEEAFACSTTHDELSEQIDDVGIRLARFALWSDQPQITLKVVKFLLLRAVESEESDAYLVLCELAQRASRKMRDFESAATFARLWLAAMVEYENFRELDNAIVAFSNSMDKIGRSDEVLDVVMKYAEFADRAPLEARVGFLLWAAEDAVMAEKFEVAEAWVREAVQLLDVDEIVATTTISLAVYALYQIPRGASLVELLHDQLRSDLWESINDEVESCFKERISLP